MLVSVVSLCPKLSLSMGLFHIEVYVLWFLVVSGVLKVHLEFFHGEESMVIGVVFSFDIFSGSLYFSTCVVCRVVSFSVASA